MQVRAVAERAARNVNITLRSGECADCKLKASLFAFLGVLVVLTVLCLAAELVCSFVLHSAQFPYRWPLLPRDYSFGDLAGFRDRFAFFHSPRFFAMPAGTAPYTYPAPIALVYEAFYRTPHYVRVFLVLVMASWTTGLFLLGRALIRRGYSLRASLLLTGTALLCSYPLWFELEQANMEVVIFLLVAAGVAAFLSRRGYTAATLFGIAAAAKIFPLIYLGLFLARRDFRRMAWMLAVAALTTVVSLWALCPNLLIAWHGVGAGLAAFQAGWVVQVRPILLTCDHSLLGLLKLLVYGLARGRLANPAFVQALSSACLGVAAVGGCILYFTVLRKLPVANQILCLVVCSILLPPVSFDYTLLHLYVPWAVLLLIATEAKSPEGLTGALICFAVLFAPETEFIHHGQSLGGQVKAVTLAILLLIAIRKRWPSRFDNLSLQDHRPGTLFASEDLPPAGN